MNSSKSSLFDLKVLLEIIILLSAMLGIKWLMDYFEILGAGSIAMWCGIVMATWFMRKSNINWKSLGLGLPKGGRDWLKNIGLALLTTVAVFLLMGLVLDPIMTSHGLEKPADAADRFQFFLGRPFVFISYLVTIVWFGAALGEELLMRGYLLNRLSNLFGGGRLSLFLALVAHASFFGVLHIYQGWAGVITASFVGSIMGVMYLVAGRRLFPVILAHAIVNTISLTAFYVTGGVVN